MKLILKLVIGIIIWLILTDIQRTYFEGHYIIYMILIAFVVSFLLFTVSKVVWFAKKKKILKFATFGTLYFFTLLLGIFLVNMIYKNIAENQFIALLNDINKYKIENSHFPRKLSELPNKHYNTYGIIPHEFIYEGYKPFVWNGIGFDESKVNSKTEKMVGYTTPLFGYSKYRIDEKEDIGTVIEDVKNKNVW